MCWAVPLPIKDDTQRTERYDITIESAGAFCTMTLLLISIAIWFSGVLAVLATCRMAKRGDAVLTWDERLEAERHRTTGRERLVLIREQPAELALPDAPPPPTALGVPRREARSAAGS